MRFDEPSGYTASYSADCAGTIANGETKTCTVTNNDQAGTLIVKKVVVNNNGGTLDAEDFTFSINGNTAVPFETDGQNDLTVNAGTYTVTEPAVAGYATTYNNCTDVFVPNGGTATCTITNDDQAATLIVKKVLITDNGSTLTVEDFEFSVNGDDPISFEADGQNDLTVDAGTYSVVETAVPGFTTTYSNCTDVVIANGGTATCTITNDDQAATLIVKKVLITDNGSTLTVEDFEFSVNGGTAVAFEADGQNDLTVDAGTYSVVETAVPGFTTTYSNCTDVVIANGGTATCTITNDDQAATLIVKKVLITDNGSTLTVEDFEFSVNGGTAVAFEADGQNDLTVDAGTYSVVETAVPGFTTTYSNCTDVVIANGGTATCTITNDDQAATLIVKKVLITDNGSTLTVEDFEFSVNGDDPISFEADGQNDLTVDAGTYSVVETAVPGFTTTYSNCTDVVIANGGTATCTITNDDQAATLIVKKVLITDNGSTLTVEDFEFSVNGGTAVAFEADGQNDLTVDAGTYSVVETAVPGFTTTYSNCTDVVIANGGTATCTITNDDQAATLIVKKVLITDNGSTLTVEDFEFSVNGGTAVAFEADGQNDLTVDAGTYSVVETAVPGFTTTYSNCTDVVIANGGTATCTITNDDQAATLIVKKHVINNNGGNKAASDWTLNSGGTDDSPDNFAGDELGTTVTLDSGSYNVTEAGPSGYAASFSADCAGTIANGETKTCTVTNNDISPTLRVVKVLVPGTDTGLFNLQIDSTTYAANVGNNGTTGPVAVNAGTHTVGETAGTGTSLSNYDTAISGDCAANGTVTLALAQNKTCTITNTRHGHIIVDKVTNPSGDSQSFNFTATGSGYANFSLTDAAAPNDQELSAGTYSVSETVPAGWDLTGASCSDGSPVTAISLQAGETVTCTFTNTKRGHIIVDKVTNPSGDAQSFSFDASGGTSPAYVDFNLTDAAAPNDQTLKPGSYSVVEGTVAGWDLTGLTCNDANGSVSPGTRTANITLDPGETVTCTFTNTKRGSIKIIKDAVPNDAQDFSFTRSFGAIFTLDDDSNATLQNNVTFSNLVPGSLLRDRRRCGRLGPEWTYL